jgi:tetratricopeptide (TPR) repeat protein
MTAKARLTRKELLKKPDEFITFTQQVINYFEKNRKIVLGVTGAVAVSTILIGVFYLWRDSNRQQALLLEQEGNRFFTSRTTRGISGMEQIKPAVEIKRALDKYKEVIANYPGSQNADRALVYIGDCYFRLNQLGDAEKHYLKYLEKHPQRGFFTMLVKQSLGYVYEVRGDYNKAIQYFTASSQNLPEQEQLRTFLDVARCYEEMGKFDFAVDYYQKVIQNAESEQNAQVIRSRGTLTDLARIKAKITRLKSRP